MNTWTDCPPKRERVRRARVALLVDGLCWVGYVLFWLAFTAAAVWPAFVAPLGGAR